MKASVFIAETLKEYGVSHVFFVEAILRRALVEMEGLGIKRVLAHSEKAAAYMADGYARASRKPGFCMAQSVGAANLASGLQEPFLARSPVVAVSGRKHSLAQNRNAYQEIRHAPLFSPVTKYSATVETAEQLPVLLRQVFREATSGAPGPAHLDLMGHQGQMIEMADLDATVVVEDPFKRVPAFRTPPEMNKVDAVVRLLTKAKKPMIIAGGGAASSQAGPELLELLENNHIPMAVSPNGKSLVPDNHPYNMGIVGRYSCRCANQLASEADLVLFVGSNTGDLVTNAWSLPGPEATVIQLDINPSELGRNLANTVSLLGDAKVTLRRIIEKMPAAKEPSEWACRARDLRRKWLEEQEADRSAANRPIRVERLCHELTQNLPADAVLVSDTGHSAIWTGTMVYLNHPGQRFLRCAGSLGWAFPASLGVKCALPDRPVVCFTGDGGFFYHLGEMETARRYGINTVTLVNNNNGLGQCRNPVNRLYQDREGRPEDMYGFSKLSFADVAQSFGLLGIRVEEPDQIGPALKQALDAGRPAVVEVMTDITCKAPDTWGGEQTV